MSALRVWVMATESYGPGRYYLADIYSIQVASAGAVLLTILK